MSAQPSTPARPFRRWFGAGCLVLAAAGLAAGALWMRPTTQVRARQAAAKGLLTEAAALYEEHLRAHPEDHAARIEQGELWKSSDPVRAIETFETVPESSAEYPMAQRHIAELSLLLGGDGRAEKALLVLLRFHPDDYGAHLALAELYHRQKDPKEALPHALRSAELTPDRVETWLLVADIYDDLGRANDMIQPLRRALALDPASMQAHLNLAYALVSSGEIEEGRRETDWCLAREPNNFTMRWLLALCEREEGRPEQALEEVRRALELSPDELRARVLEGQLLLYLKRPDEAYRRLKPLLSRYGTSRWLLTPLAQAATATGRRDEAQEYHNRSSIQREKDDPRSAE